MASWRTTAAGVVGSILVILGGVSAALKGDHVDVMPIMEALGSLALAVGLIHARDNKVSSEEAGAK